MINRTARCHVMSGFFLQQLFDLDLKVIRHRNGFLCRFVLLKLFAHLVVGFGQPIAGGKHPIGLFQRVLFGNHFLDAMLSEFVFDKIDQLPRSHGVQLDARAAEEIDRTLTKTSLRQSVGAYVAIGSSSASPPMSPYCKPMSMTLWHP
jgi:hypothetical protein